MKKLSFLPFCLWHQVCFHFGTREEKNPHNIQYYILIVVRMYFIFIYEVFFYLFHEGLAQTHNLGKKNGIVGEMRAQVAEHAECFPAQVLKVLCRSRGSFALQRMQWASLGPF